MTPTEKYWNFIQQIANQIPAIRKKVLADGDGLDRFVESTVSEDMYPCLLSIRPRYRASDNGMGMFFAYFEAKIYIVCKTQINDYGTDDLYARVDGDYNNAETLATELGSKINHYNRDRTTDPFGIEFSFNDWSAEPVQFLTTDNCVGYEITFRIGLPAADVLC